MSLSVLDGDREYCVRGRIALIVRWLVARAERLMIPDRLAVTFDCAGSSVSAEVKEREAVDAAFLR